jgi:hypothetical protein
MAIDWQAFWLTHNWRHGIAGVLFVVGLPIALVAFSVGAGDSW